MNYTYLHYQIGMTLLTQVGPIKAREILRHFQTAETFFHSTAKEIQSKCNFSASFIRNLNRKKALEKSHEVLEHALKNNIHIIFDQSPEYPRRLKQCIDAPLLMYCQGNVSMNPSKTLAIVGTRKATKYGLKITEEIIEQIQGQDIVVISGLAEGIDTTVHQSCLKYDIPTLAVLGHGLDRIYPASNRKLAEEMIASGALLTEFIPGTIPDRENFPKRNRIVAGMSDATVVIESDVKGGSLITARLASDYNRDVFAVPGNINQKYSSGCNTLIKEQRAQILLSTDQLFQEMNWRSPENKIEVTRSAFPQLNPQQQSIVDLLRKEERLQIDLISIHTELPISKLNIELFNLEMEGVVQALPGKVYQLA